MYLTTTDYDRFTTLPIALPETELRRQKYIQIASFTLLLGQRLELICCNLQVLNILTYGVAPVLADGTLGLASVGFMASTMISSAVGLVTVEGVGTMTLNSDQPVIVTAPGTYSAVVLNNSLNVDLAVVVTGSVRILS